MKMWRTWCAENSKGKTLMNDQEMHKLLAELHLETAKDLLKRVKSGEATPGELNAALKMLKDNGIEAIPTPDSPLGDLKAAIPQFNDDEANELH